MSELPFNIWLENAIAEAPRSPTSIPLIGYDQLDLQDAPAVPLINVLANIIEATCTVSTAVPTTHASVA